MRHNTTFKRTDRSFVCQKMRRIAIHAMTVMVKKKIILNVPGIFCRRPNAAPVFRTWMISKYPGRIVMKSPIWRWVRMSHFVNWSMR